MGFDQIIIGEDILLTELIRGNRHAFTKLYFQYSGMVFSKLLQLTKCEDTSKEILQELFIKVWEKKEHIDINKLENTH